MWTRLTLLAVVAAIAGSTTTLAQRVQRYAAPRTEHGFPSFQGVWATEFLTMLERPPGVDSPVVNREQAERLADTMRALAPAVNDPQFQLDNVRQLAMVKGEYRTSVIVDPTDGRMPFTEAGSKLAVSINARNASSFDHPEQRPLSERSWKTWAMRQFARSPSYSDTKSCKLATLSSSFPKVRQGRA